MRVQCLTMVGACYLFCIFMLILLVNGLLAGTYLLAHVPDWLQA